MGDQQLSPQQVQRYGIIQRLITRDITEKEAGELLNRSARQVRRLKRKVMIGGPLALIHRNIQRTPWNRRDDKLTTRIVTLYETKYYGFNCLHFKDMLEDEGVRIGRESLREIFITHGFPRRKKRVTRRYQRRERKPQPGLLIQQDGSPHDWFGTGNPCTLIASIDDANNEVVFAKFFLQEGTLPHMEAIKTIVETKGVFVALYVDRASCFKTIRHESIHVQLTGNYENTQVQRALKEVGSTLIPALSAQAKGRVERLFETLQDRLVHELKLAGVTTIAAGNIFLASFLPRFNKRFMVTPASNQTAYRPPTNHLNLALIFSVQGERVVRADNTISFEGTWYQLQATKTRVSFAKAVVTVHQCIDGRIRILYKGEEIPYTPSLW